MGPPLVQAAVPKMGVRVCMDWSKKKEVLVQPPPRYDSLVPGFLNGLPDGLQSPDARLQLLGLRSPSRRSLARLRRSNSEVTISDVGVEDLDLDAVNPNTGATLGRRYGSTSTLDRLEARRGGEEPSAPLPDAPRRPTPLSPSLRAAAQIARGDIVSVRGRDYVEASVYCRDGAKTEASILGRRQSSKYFSHYDVQSIFFSIAPETDLSPTSTAITTVTASTAASINVHAEFEAVGDDGDRRSALLVDSPPFLSEIGGETETKLNLNPACSATCRAPGSCSQTALGCSNATVSVLEACRDAQVFSPNLPRTHGIEHLDLGARYYLKYFYNKDHQNYFGVDKNVGPVSLSVRRERLDDRKDEFLYRIILRTGQLSTLRGSILEDSVPSSSKHGTSRGLPLKDVLELVVPELNIQSLRRASSSPRVPELLLQLDQQELNLQSSVGVLFCRAGQTTEDHMYNNETGSPALDQFLDLLGQKVPLRSFSKSSSQLDSGDSAGSQSVYTTFRDFELTFHVSTLLPFTPNDPTQPLRKRLLGNSMVMVIFQEADALPFDPRKLRSHLQQVFIVVRVHRPCSQHTCYSVAVSRCRDVPSFGPSIPPGWMFPASADFRDFLLVKIINAGLAAHRSDTSVAIATRRRQEQLNQLAETFITSTPADSSSSSSVRFSFISLAGRKKERSAPRPHAYLQSAGAVTWSVAVPDPSSAVAVACLLAISSELVVLAEEASRQVVFACCCRDVIGWRAAHGAVKLFYRHGNGVMFSTRDGRWADMQDISQRLQLVTGGSPAADMTLRRNRLGQLGFHVNVEGVVADVEAHGFAWQAGLRPGCRLMEICTVVVATLSHEKMIELLRTSATVSAVVIPPNRDGTPRRSFSEIYRVPMFECKLDSDVTSCSYPVVPPTWHQVSEAPPIRSATSNESIRCGPQSLIRQSSSFHQREGCSSPSRSTSSDPGPFVTQQSSCRALPDWLISRDESSTPPQETCGWTRCKESKQLHHPHQRPNHVTAVPFDQMDPETVSLHQKFSGCSNTLSSSSSSEEPRVAFIRGVSVDSGIDSALSISKIPPPIAGATLLLRDVHEKGVISVNAQVTCSPSREKCGPIRDVKKKQLDVTVGQKCISRVLAPSPWRSLTRSASHDSLFRTSNQKHLPSNKKPPALLRSELHFSDSHLVQRPKRTEPWQKPLPQVSSLLDLCHLVDAAQISKGVCSLSSLCDIDQLRQAVEMTSETSTLQDSDITASLSGKVFQLEEILHQLQFDLMKEQQDKAALQQQVQNLRQDNRRLQEESQSAAEQIRRFTTWILKRDTLP